MPADRPRVAFTGYYGMTNFGDDLFGALCAKAARAYWNSTARIVGPQIRGVGARYTMPAWFPQRTYGAHNVLGQGSRLLSLVRALASSDLLVYGGGSTVTGRDSYRPALLSWARDRAHIELAAVGISIGPFADEKTTASAAEFLRRFTYVSVRDARSYELATSMDLPTTLHRGRDLAGLLPLLAAPVGDGAAVSATRERLGVSLCNYPAKTDYDAPEREHLLGELCDAITDVAQQRALRVELFSLCNHPQAGDQILTERFARRLRQRGLEPELHSYGGEDPVGMAHRIGSCHAFVSARLHGAIVAYVLGVPLATIEYHAKCRDFAADIGLPDVRRIRGRRPTQAAIGSAVQNVLDGSDRPSLARSQYAEEALGAFRASPWWAAGTDEGDAS